MTTSSHTTVILLRQHATSTVWPTALTDPSPVGNSTTPTPMIAVEVTAPSALTVSDAAYMPNPFTVAADVSNSGDAPAEGVSVAISLPAGLRTTDPSSVTLGTLSAADSKHITWQVTADPQTNAATLTYGVAAGGNDVSGVSQTRQIYLPELPAPPGKLKIVALGDSVASGEGTRFRWHYVLSAEEGNGKNGVWQGTWQEDELNPTWEPTTDDTPAVQNCHRSTDGYPYKVAAALDADLFDAACSGAGAGNGILRHQTFGDGTQAERPQLGIAEQLYDPPNPRYDSFNPDAVTLTLGANDIDFSTLLVTCYKSAVPGAHYPFCSLDPALDKSVDRALRQQKANLDKVLSEIVARGKAAGKVPHIVVTTYYDPFPRAGVVCKDIKPALGNRFGLSAGEVIWLESKRLQLNRNIRDVAKAHRGEVKIVELETAFAGHEWCTEDPWAYGASIRVLPGQDDNAAPFHPTPYGQTAIARLVAAKLKQF